MDNLSSQKQARTRQFIEAADAALLFRPPYSPDLNPIENVFSKLKQLMRSLAARSRKALWNAMQSLLDQITAIDAVHFFAHGGYSLHLN